MAKRNQPKTYICLIGCFCYIEKGEGKMSTDMAIKVLDESLGKTVLIKLKGGQVIRGTLQGFDQHMNLVLDSSESILEDGRTEKLGTIIVRGDNVVMVSPP